MTELQNFVDNFGLEISKEKLVREAYHAMKALGHDVCILNTIYLIVDDQGFQFIKSKKNNCWIVKEL